MSDSYSSGQSAAAAAKERKTKCPKSRSKSKAHRWKQKGGWPSLWEECSLCKRAIFWK